MFPVSNGMNILGKKYIFLTISLVLVATSLFAVFSWGLKLGIDFTGGSLLEVEFPGQEVPLDMAKTQLEPLVGTLIVQPVDAHALLLRFGPVDEATHQKIVAILADIAPEKGHIMERRFDSIGPTIGNELKRQAIMALLLAILAITLYITWVFRRVSRPVPAWNYGIVTVVALLHDAILPIGLFAFLGKWHGIEVEGMFITALLTVIGFSVHDTIVVFDRIRENLTRLKTSESYEVTVNRSLQQTIVRSINTSFTVLLVLIAIFWFGGETVRYFSLALIFGIFFGTYSSIFVASPLLVVWHQIGGGERRDRK